MDLKASIQAGKLLIELQRNKMSPSVRTSTNGLIETLGRLKCAFSPFPFSLLKTC